MIFYHSLNPSMNFQGEQEFPLSIIIPAFNEESRLTETVRDLADYMASQKSAFVLKELLLIDDGSEDRTLDVMTDLKRQWNLIRIIHFSDNQGKGAAVHAGLQKAQASWILIADADQSTPWSEMETLRRACLEQKADLAIGSRALESSQVQIRQAWWRQGMGQFFNRIVRALFALSFLDTQCGFKLWYRTPRLRFPLENLRIQRFAWDVEFILKIQRAGGKVVEIPVIWRNKLHSRVHPLRDSLEMLYQLIKLRWFASTDSSHHEEQ